jgi:hypothetical protein
LFEEITFHKYKKKRDVFKLLASALVEPFFYPVHTWFAVKGNYEAIRGKKEWGKAIRSGFEKKIKRTVVRRRSVRQLANIGRSTKSDSTT